MPAVAEILMTEGILKHPRVRRLTKDTGWALFSDGARIMLQGIAFALLVYPSAQTGLAPCPERWR